MTNPLVSTDPCISAVNSTQSNHIESATSYACASTRELLHEELHSFLHRSGLKILALGYACANQTRVLSSLFTDATILVLDGSAQAITEINGLQLDSVTAMVADFHAPASVLSTIESCGHGFDIIVSIDTRCTICNHKPLLGSIAKFLHPHGRMLLIGPSQYNNREVLPISSHHEAESSLGGEDYLSEMDMAALFYHYPTFRYYHHIPLHFRSHEDFLAYSQHSGLYTHDLAHRVAAEVATIIKHTGVFSLTMVWVVIVIEAASEYGRARHLPPTLASDSFSPELYSHFLAEARRHNYTILKLNELLSHTASPNPIMLLRHDIDIAPQYALKMALIEAENDIQSSYFFMINSGFYNALESRNRQIIKAIADMGHEIGLHWDTTDTLAQDIQILSTIIQKPITSVSQHNPTINGLQHIRSNNLLDAYDQAILQEHAFIYVSDSGMKWRSKTIFDLMGQQRLYFLCHPESWYSQGNDLIQLLRKLQYQEEAKLKSTFNHFIDGNISYLAQRKLNGD